MGKDSVSVVLYAKNGIVIPQQFKGGVYGDWVKILESKNLGRRVSIIAGSVGIKYSCKFIYDDIKREIGLFDEGDYTWFIENDDLPHEKSDKNNKDCPYCYQEIKKPLEEKHQGRVSIFCPHCRYRLVEWENNI